MSNTPPSPRQSDICAIPCFDHDRVARVRKSLATEQAGLPELAEFYKLLGNTTRLKILLALMDGELCVCDVANVLGLSMAATSHQLKLLRDRGWLSKRDDGKMVYYQLDSVDLVKALQGDLKMLDTHRP